MTLHGSHNVDVLDNIAYDHFGHCFMLEDGGEKWNRFEGNLGFGTRSGILESSDSESTTFWITSPLTVMIDNVAAGSNYTSGVGMWYLFPDDPVVLSLDKGFYGHLEAKHTPILEFRNNVAHSNGNAGLAFFRRLGEDHEIIDCSTYSPRVNRKDNSSEFQPVEFNGFIGILFHVAFFYITFILKSIFLRLQEQEKKCHNPLHLG